MVNTIKPFFIYIKKNRPSIANMINYSRVAKDARESNIRHRSEESRGQDVVDLSIGSPSLPFILNGEELALVEAEAARVDAFRGYTGIGGIASFLNAAKSWLGFNYGEETFGEDNCRFGVIPNNSSSQGLFSVGQLLEPISGGHILIPSPSYPNAARSLAASNHTIKFAATHKGDAFVPTASWLRDNYQEGKTYSVLITMPNNPSGSSFTHDQVRDLAAEINNITAKDPNITFVFDSAYQGMAPNDSGNPMNYLSQESKGRVIILETLSKIFAGANVRMGWIFAPTGVIEKLNGIMALSTNNVGAFPQLLAAKAMDKLMRNPTITALAADEYNFRVDLINSAVNKITGENSSARSGGMFAFRSLGLTGLPIPRQLQNMRSPLNRSRAIGTDGIITNGIDSADAIRYAGSIKPEGLHFTTIGVIGVEGEEFNVGENREGYVRLAATKEPSQLLQALGSIWVLREQALVESRGEAVIPPAKIDEINQWYYENAVVINKRAVEKQSQIARSDNEPALQDYLRRVYELGYDKQQAEGFATQLEEISARLKSPRMITQPTASQSQQSRQA
jgi:aspartate/methionine/tyrosine aminotransferase